MMAELAKITSNGKLVSEQQWKKHIAALKRKTRESSVSKAKLRQDLTVAILEAIDKRIPHKNFGVMLSGGVDSTLIAYILKKQKAKFTCYSVGIETSKDIEAAKEVAKALKLTHRYKVYSLAEMEKLIKKATKIVGDANVVNVGVAAVELAAIELAKKDNINIFFGGLGSEEIFAGYQRHSEAKDINKECWNGLKNMHGRDFIRDAAVATVMKATFLVPLLDENVILKSMKIPGKYKLNKNEKKIILREVAVDLGLENKFAFRKKIAAQYGSGFDKAIDKLARKKGYKYKKEYLKSLL